MSHELSFINGIAEFAYLQKDGPAWHGFGQPVPDEHAGSIDYWLAASNMGNWNINSAVALFFDEGSEEVMSFDSRKILYRDDTRQPLADVGAYYQVVQPRDVVEFFRDICQTMGFEMATCGVLYGGKRFWAQANIGQSISLLGQDRVDGKLLLSTSCDGSLATQAQYTTERVVCRNTLRAALGVAKDFVRVTHATTFNPESIKEALELKPQAMLEWQLQAETLCRYQIDHKQAGEFFDLVFNGPVKANQIIPEDALATAEQILALNGASEETRGNSQAIDTCLTLFNGAGMGMNLDSAKGTLWGAVNAITEWSDHHRACKTLDARINHAWFGNSAQVKDRAWEEAILLAA